MEIGVRLKQLREKCGYSQNYLADLAGVSQTHLRRVELGQADITVGHLRLICDALGITLNDFFNTTNEAEEISAVVAKLSVRQRILLMEFLKSL